MIYETGVPSAGLDIGRLNSTLKSFGVKAQAQDGVICIIAPEQPPRETMIKIDGFLLGFSVASTKEIVHLTEDGVKSILMRRHLWPNVREDERLVMADILFQCGSVCDLGWIALVERFKQLQEFMDFRPADDEPMYNSSSLRKM